jgi:hypothetical protein
MCIDLKKLHKKIKASRKQVRKNGDEDDVKQHDFYVNKNLEELEAALKLHTICNKLLDDAKSEWGSAYIAHIQRQCLGRIESNVSDLSKITHNIL